MKLLYFCLFSLLLHFPFSLFPNEMSFPIKRISYVCGCKPDTINPAGTNKITYQGNYCGYQEISLFEIDFSELRKRQNIKKAELHIFCQKTVGDLTESLLYKPIVEKWDDNVTFQTLPKTNNSKIIKTKLPLINTFHIVDITDIVRNKFNAEYHGIMGYSNTSKGKTFSVIFTSIDTQINMPKIVLYFD